MTIEKLPSGSYRATVMQDGIRYRRTFDHKPTQKEVLQALSDAMESNHSSTHSGLSFEDAAAKFCESKKNTLSPKTYREYTMQFKRLPEWFRLMNIYDVDQIALNQLVGELNADKKPKTVKNIHGMISSVMKTYRPNLAIRTALPQAQKVYPYIPSTVEIKLLLKNLENTEFEIPFILGCYGLRRSEICALTLDDLEGTTIHINKALVQNADNEWVIKQTKTTDSTRDVIIPKKVADKIRAKGYVYQGFPHSISRHISALEKKLGIPHFSMHKLRHYFASEMSSLGISDADIMALGGWSTDHVMKTVYRHAMIDKNEKAKKAASAKLTKEIFG